MEGTHEKIQGRVKICVCEAELTRDTEMIGQMDPYVVIK